MLVTGSRAVTDIVEAAQSKKRREQIEKERKKKEREIKQNWTILKSKGYAYEQRYTRSTIKDYDKGRMLYDVLPDKAWNGQRCFIIGGGKSLEGFDFSQLKGELVIGVNRAYEKIDCTILFSMDNKFYCWIKEGKLGQEAKDKFNDFKGYPVWIDSVGYNYPAGIFILNKSNGNVVNYRMKSGINTGNNSGFGALNLAACLGANPIYLLGYDMEGENGKQAWWHNGYPNNHSEKIYGSFINNFKRAALDLKKKKIKVINLNPKSKLRCFDFGKIEEIEPIKRPIITSYYTKKTGYEKQVKELKTTLRRFNLDNDVVGITDRGSWHKNTYYKANFIMRMMRKHPDRAIVFVDADAKIRANPVLFNKLDCDFACHFRHGKELLAGTLYFGSTKGARFLVRKWIEENKNFPLTHMPQKNLQTVFERYKDKITWKKLPIEYCMIFDTAFRHSTNPVIEHYQLSRIYKTSASGQRYRMIRSLDKIQEFIKDKDVCLIGNANSVLREKRDIDKFDVVCRMNRGTPKGKKAFIGSRTDILFLSTNMSGANIKTNFSPRHVIWMTICTRLASPWALSNAIQNPRRDWKLLYKKLSINPTTGIMALNFLLRRTQFKSLTIYGFDFFRTKTWYNTKIDSGQKHSGKKEKVLFMEMIKERSNVRFV